MTNTISEETIASIVDAAKNIADDSTAMRQNVIKITDALNPMFREAGIEFRFRPPYNDCEAVWTERYNPNAPSEKRWLSVRSGWGGKNIFVATGSHGAQSFSSVSRNSIDETIKHLPKFLLAYCEELSQRGAHFADIREKAEAILKIVEG